MIAWIGVIVALVFFVLWGGGFLRELGRRQQTGAPDSPPALQPPTDREPAVPDDTRLQVFEDFIRSLPENDSDGPTTPAA